MQPKGYRDVIRFSNLGGLIVIDCLFIFLTSFLKPQIPGELKVALIQKELMRLSFLQTDEPIYFPQLEFGFSFSF